MKIQHVDHIGIIVNDLAAAKAFFIDFGFTVLGEHKMQGELLDRVLGLHDARTEFAMLQAPDAKLNLEIIKFHHPTDQTVVQPAPVNALGLRHIAFVVEDMESIVDTLKQKGWNAFSDIQTYEDPLKSFNLCYIHGPEGIIVELAEQIKK